MVARPSRCPVPSVGGDQARCNGEFGSIRPPRFFVSAPQDCRTRLLAPTFLDRYLNLLDAPPAVLGEWLLLPTTPLTPEELGRHVMECHRRLAELGGPCAAAFGRVADQIAQELGAKSE